MRGIVFKIEMTKDPAEKLRLLKHLRRLIVLQEANCKRKLEVLKK